MQFPCDQVNRFLEVHFPIANDGQNSSEPQLIKVEMTTINILKCVCPHSPHRLSRCDKNIPYCKYDKIWEKFTNDNSVQNKNAAGNENIQPRNTHCHQDEMAELWKDCYGEAQIYFFNQNSRLDCKRVVIYTNDVNHRTNTYNYSIMTKSKKDERKQRTVGKQRELEGLDLAIMHTFFKMTRRMTLHLVVSSRQSPYNSQILNRFLHTNLRLKKTLKAKLFPSIHHIKKKRKGPTTKLKKKLSIENYSLKAAL